MKQTLVFAIALGFFQQLTAQDALVSFREAGRPEHRVSAVETPSAAMNRPAAFDRLGQYIAQNLRYPERARTYGIEGTVVAEISISATGKVTGVTLVKTLGFGCDEAVVALLSAMPDWSPARQNGQAMAQRVTVPVRFRLR